MSWRNGYLDNIVPLFAAAYVFCLSGLAELAESSWAYHLHFLTATFRVPALVAQNLSIHRAYRALYGRIGQGLSVPAP